MQIKTILHMDKHNEDSFQYQHLKQETRTSAEKNKLMAAFLTNVLENELTERQRICASDFWLNGKKQNEIAQELGLSRSTVSRHIAAAKRKLRHAAKYAPTAARAFRV